MPYTVIEDVVVPAGEGVLHYPAGTRIADDLPETAELLAAGKIVPEGQEPAEAVAVEEVLHPYTVVEEFIVQRGDTAVHISDIGSVVELTDAEATAAGPAVARVGDEPADEPEPADETGSGDETPEGGEESADSAEGESGEPSEDDTPHGRRSRRP